jgi:hypothetical protein
MRAGYVHRVSWLGFVGPIPDDLTVNHRCEVKRCVNPDHLELLTRPDHAAHENAKNPRTPRRTLRQKGKRPWHYRLQQGVDYTIQTTIDQAGKVWTLQSIK